MRTPDLHPPRGRALVLASTLTLTLVCGIAHARDKVVLTMRSEIFSADLLIALEEGYFEQQGLDVELVTWNNSTTMLPSLAHGDVDFSTTSSLSPSYVNLIHRGAPIRLVAARSVHEVGACPYVAFVARSELIDSGRLTDLQSLRGLRVATSRTSPSFYYWARLFERARLTPDDVVFKNVPDDVKVEAIARDLVDVTSTIEPKITRLVESGDGKVWLPISAATPDRQNTFLLFGPRLLHERRDLGQRVMNAYLAGRAQYLEGKTERNVRILAARLGAEPDELRRWCWPSQSADPHIDAGGLEDFQNWALGEGLIDAIVPFSKLVDHGFLDQTPAASETPRTTPPSKERP